MAGPERKTGQLSEDAVRAISGCQVVQSLESEAEHWPFHQSDIGSHWRVLSPKVDVI